jgi:hypothetical protein
VGKNEESIVFDWTGVLTACMGGRDPLETPFRTSPSTSGVPWSKDSLHHALRFGYSVEKLFL